MMDNFFNIMEWRNSTNRNTWIVMNKFGALWILCIVTIFTLIADADGKRPAKIVGGTETAIDKFPSLVSIRIYHQHICGGALITNKHVLTAGHCVVFKPKHRRFWEKVWPAKVFSLHVGSNSSESLDNELQVERVHVHENYTGDHKTNYHDDIAILTLREAIEPSSTIAPIALASKDPVIGQMGHIAGWGFVKENGPKSLILKKALAKIYPNGMCWKIPDTQLCTSTGYGVGFCDGDSGGPLIINNEVVGIISNSQGCGTGHPDVYTRVRSYINWINNITNSIP